MLLSIKIIRISHLKHQEEPKESSMERTNEMAKAEKADWKGLGSSHMGTIRCIRLTGSTLHQSQKFNKIRLK